LFLFFSLVFIRRVQFLVYHLENTLEDLAPLFGWKLVHVPEVEEVGAGANVRLLGLGLLIIWHERIISADWAVVPQTA
jgi:hypothetical protein